MTTSTDTFLTFVDQLAKHLDRHDLNGADLASGAFLSRYHFARVIRAAAGEAPSQFRRRILLERAAYTLATRSDGILRTAIDAGYSSNEAFTRAFRRAYGMTPSEWRTAPGQIRIASPNDVHFHPPGGLRMPGRAEGTEMNLITRMVEHHVWLLGELLDAAGLLSDQELDAPIELPFDGIDDSPTVRSLLSRLIGQMDMWNNVMAGRAYDWSVEEDEPIASMRKRLDSAGSDFLADVRHVVEDNRLDETFIDAHCEPVEVFTYGGLIAHVLTFAAHRRLLVLGALDAAGASSLGYGDPRKWVAEAV
jgi:AraC-like DNA-binding protein